MGEKQCTCQCHTWGTSCHGFGFGDKNCCDLPHVMFDEWKTRIDPTKKKELMATLQEQAKSVHSEGGIMQWIREMDVPDHIKIVLSREISMIGYRCANFEDVCEFDVPGNKQWALDVLEKFL